MFPSRPQTQESLPLLPQAPFRQRTAGSLVLSSTGRKTVSSLRTATAPTTHNISNWPNTPNTARESTRGGYDVIHEDFPINRKKNRPPLVFELEAFIRKELFTMQQALQRQLSPFERFPVFSEVFGVLISHFSEYGELFGLIKKEYDEIITTGMKAEQQFERLKAETNNTQSFFSYQIHSERSKAEAEVQAQKLKNENLQERMTQLKKENQKWLLEQEGHKEELEKLIEDNKDLEHRNKVFAEGLRNEALRSSLLVSQGQKLKADNEKLQSLCAALDAKIKNDQLLMESAGMGQNKRQQSFRGTQGLKTLKGVVSAVTGQGGKGGRVDVQDLDDDSAELLLEAQEKIKRLQKKVVEFDRTVNKLQKRLKVLGEERGGRPMTPRPDWSQLEEMLDEFDPKPEEKRTTEIVKELAEVVQERLGIQRERVERLAQSKVIREWFADENLCESDLVHRGKKSFIGLGTGPHVPIYFRHHGLVRKIPLRKGACEDFLKQFWEEREARSRVDGLELKPIDEFYHEWLGWDFKAQRKRNNPIELAYNMIDVCERYRSDPDCGMFLSIIQGQMSEATYVDQISLVSRLESMMDLHDKFRNGMLPKKEFHTIVRKFFPAKSRDDMLKLRFSLLPFTRNNKINYRAVFEENDEGDQTRFVELMRSQHLYEITEYVVDVEEALRMTLTATGRIPLGPAKTAIKTLDPQIPQERLMKIIANGAKCTVEQLEKLGEGHHVDAEEFLKRIRTGELLKRYTRKLAEEDDDDGVEDVLDGLEGSSDEAEEEEDSSELSSEAQEIDFGSYDAALLNEAKEKVEDELPEEEEHEGSNEVPEQS